jgi:hypothetical protein
MGHPIILKIISTNGCTIVSQHDGFDLKSCDIFLWGWAKKQIYCTKQRFLEELEERIASVLTKIPGNMLWSPVANVPVQLRKCADNGGENAEI